MPGAAPGGSSGGTHGTSHTSSTGDTDRGVGWKGWLKGATDTVVNYGTAIVTTPDIWWGTLELTLGVAGMLQGGVDAVGGVMVCLSGAGCLAGAPAAAFGAGLMVGGAYVATAGAERFSNGLGKALNEAKANSESAGSKPVHSGTPSWIPESASSKVPEVFGGGKATKKGVGWRWNDGKGNGVRIDKGNPNNSQPYQQVDHVVINSGGRIIGRNGGIIEGDIKSNAFEAHIPLKDWVKWKTWNSPN